MTIPEIETEIATLQAQLNALLNPNPPVLTAKQIQINNLLIEYIGKRCTLNPSVPPEVSCAEAVSFLLQKLNINTGTQGIAGTATLLAFALAHPEIFLEIYSPEESALLISATGTGNGLVEGHAAFYGAFGRQYTGDWGIVSNNSQTGLLGEQWSEKEWVKNYQQLGGIPPRRFRVIG